MLITLGNASLAEYPQGGGHWTWFIQYPLGLRALGHRVFWLELLRSCGNADEDHRRVKLFFDRLEAFGLKDCCGLLLFSGTDAQSLESCESFNLSTAKIAELARDSDLLWNFWYALRQPLTGLFKRRAFIDVDPGHFQVCALDDDREIRDYHAFLTVGAKIGDADCEVPTLGLRWRHFRPFVYLPLWEAVADAPPRAPFTSITQWTWEELVVNGRSLSLSKRTAYLRYAELPLRSRRPFELAVNIGPVDAGNDRPLLEKNGWRIVDPHQVAASPSAYRRYIAASRAEILCPKPAFRDLKTGWFSDRSVCYLASGRPVLAEETGFGEWLPGDGGVVAFRDLDQAVAGVAEIDGNYARHSRIARQLAEGLFDSRRCLDEMISASFAD